MKKSFLLIASAIMIIAGCTKESSIQKDGNGDVTVSVTVGLPDTGTKAVADNDGNAVKANHWIMEVRDAQGEVFYREVKTASEGTLKQTFEVALIKNQSYNFLFWADNDGGYYNTDDLTNVTLTNYKGNNDARDAFSASKAYTANTNERLSVKLYRPFAQVNVITTDLQKLWKQAKTTSDPDATYLKFEPTDFIAVLKVPTSFNVKTQECGAATTDVTITSDECYTAYQVDSVSLRAKNNYKRHTNPATLFMDYVFASKSQKDVVDIAFQFTSNALPVNYAFTSIPLQANYRTNIIGQLLSYDTEWVVEIIPTWETPDYDIPVFQTTVDNIEKLNDVLASSQAAGVKELTATATMPTDSDTEDVTFTSVNNSQVINLKFEGSLGTNKTLTFKNDAGANGPSTLNIVAPAGTKLEFTNPQTHVIINGTSYENISGSFSAHSLIIAKGITVKNLSIAKGGVEIHGEVENVTVTGTAADVFVRDCEGLSETVYNVLKPYIAPGYTGKENGGKWDIVLADNWSSHAAKDYAAKNPAAKTLTIASAEQLALFRNELAKDKFCYSGYTVTIGANIDLKEYIWEPIPEMSSVVIDGTNHTIFNLTVNGDNRYGNAFISYSYGCTIKNIIFDNASITRKGTEYSGNIYAVVTAYPGYYANATFENVTVKDSFVSAYGKVGAIAGMAEMQGNTLKFKDCKVVGTTLKGAYNIGGLIGLFQYQVSDCKNTLLIENCPDVDYTFIPTPLPDRNFNERKTIEGLAGTFLIDSDGDYSAENAKYYCEYGNPVALANNADALIHNTPDNIIPE